MFSWSKGRSGFKIVIERHGLATDFSPARAAIYLHTRSLLIYPQLSVHSSSTPRRFYIDLSIPTRWSVGSQTQITDASALKRITPPNATISGRLQSKDLGSRQEKLIQTYESESSCTDWVWVEGLDIPLDGISKPTELGRIDRSH